MVFKKGIHVCKNGWRAIIAQTKCINGQWVLRGAIDRNGVLYISKWDLKGLHLSNREELDLK